MPPRGVEGMTIQTYSRYRKPIPWNNSASLPPPTTGGVSPSTSAFQAKIFMVSLSQLGVGLSFCLKDLWSPKLGYARKIKNKFFLKLKFKFLNLKTASDMVHPRGFFVDLDELYTIASGVNLLPPS